MRVASELVALPQSTVGLYLPLGSRRVPAVQLAALQEACSGAHISATSTRDLLSLSVLSAPADTAAGLEALARFVRRGSVADVMISTRRTQSTAPLSDPETALMELIHQAAYPRGSPLGAPSAAAVDLRALTPGQRVAAADAALRAIQSCAAHDVVVAAAGPDVSDFEAAAQRELAGLFRGSQRQQQQQRANGSDYRGGKVLCSAEEWQPRLCGPRAHLAHIGLCFESPVRCLGSRDLHALLVACAVLGGGSSFSQGGPGKGMWSRLYRHVLSQPWAESARAVATYGSDGGLVGVVGACEPAAAGRMVVEMAQQLVMLALAPLGKEELQRGQSAAASSIALAVEGSSGVCDDLGTQVLLRGRRDTPQQVVEALHEVRAEDVQRVVRRALASRPTIAGIVPRAFRRAVVPVSVLQKQVAYLLALCPPPPAATTTTKKSTK